MGNIWGEHFRVSTFGESHGQAIGVVIDGCPAGLELTEDDIQTWLDRRRPGVNSFVSPRQEKDQARILSGVYQSKTTGAPLAIIVENHNTESKAYEHVHDVLRPGHASFTYWQKWQHTDPRGGGRASARETISRVCAGAVASKVVQELGIYTTAYVRQIGHIRLDLESIPEFKSIEKSPVRCPDMQISQLMEQLLHELIQAGDSIGGLVQAHIQGLPIGLGEPVFDRFEANLAKAMLSLPASKAFSIGNGFSCVNKRGSEFNDLFELHNNGVDSAQSSNTSYPTALSDCLEVSSECDHSFKFDPRLQLKTNSSSGVLAGITTGQTLNFQLAFKPASSIRLPQPTYTIHGDKKILEWPQGFRHDPCVAIRACPVVEAMALLVSVDALLSAGFNTMSQIKRRYSV